MLCIRKIRNWEKNILKNKGGKKMLKKISYVILVVLVIGMFSTGAFAATKVY